jgi:hypothetical protein
MALVLPGTLDYPPVGSFNVKTAEGRRRIKAAINVGGGTHLRSVEFSLIFRLLLYNIL